MSEAGPITTTPASARAGGRPRVRVRLADLMLWVLGAGVGAAVCRASRPASWLMPTIDEERLFAFGAALLTVFLGLALVRQAVALARRSGSAGGLRLAAVTWRMVVVAVLGASLITTVRLLERDVELDGWLVPVSVRMRLSLLALAMTFAMAGVVAGLSPRRGQAWVRPPRMAWLSVVWAAAASVPLAANQAFIPYLVLIAIHAVRNARAGPAGLLPPRTNVDQRILSAAAESLPVLACCLLLALLVGRELRRHGPRSKEIGSAWLGPRVLLATTAVAVAGAAWLLGVTIPRLDECLAEGFRLTIDPLNAVIIILGFAGLTLGIAARAADGSRCPESDQTAGPRPTSWLRIVRDWAIALVLLDLILAKVVDWIVAQGPATGRSVSESWTRWVGWTNAAFARLPSVRAGDGPLDLLLNEPGWVLMAFGQAWITWRVVCLLIAPVGDEPTPIDVWLGDRRTFGRFAIRWLALTVLMVAALPTLFVAGLGLLIAFFKAFG